MAEINEIIDSVRKDVAAEAEKISSAAVKSAAECLRKAEETVAAERRSVSEKLENEKKAAQERIKAEIESGRKREFLRQKEFYLGQVRKNITRLLSEKEESAYKSIFGGYLDSCAAVLRENSLCVIMGKKEKKFDLSFLKARFPGREIILKESSDSFDYGLVISTTDFEMDLTLESIAEDIWNKNRDKAMKLFPVE